MSSVAMRLDAVRALVRAAGKVVVAFSGGVDSTLVSFMASRELGHDALVVLARTETIVPEDVDLARSIAARYEFNFLELSYSELAIEQYAANPVNRCYYCKHALFERLVAIARERGAEAVFDGSNADDEGDYRPGRQAARELGIRSPLVECGFTKADVRAAAKYLGLSNHDKPAAPCLSSRIPYGTFIDADSLIRISRAEREIRSYGFGNVRVRHRGRHATIEVDRHDIGRVRSFFPEIERRLREIGYLEVVIDEEGFSSGKLNRHLDGTDPVQGPG